MAQALSGGARAGRAGRALRLALEHAGARYRALFDLAADSPAMHARGGSLHTQASILLDHGHVQEDAVAQALSGAHTVIVQAEALRLALVRAGGALPHAFRVAPDNCATHD